MTVSVRLRAGLTPAVTAGPWIKALLAWGSLVALALFGALLRVRRRRDTAGHTKTPAPEGTGVSEKA